MEAGHSRSSKQLNRVCMSDLVKLQDPLNGHGWGGGGITDCENKLIP